MSRTEPNFEDVDFGDVERRFALQRKPFVTLADVLDQLTESLKKEFGNSVGACDLTIVNNSRVSSENKNYKLILGYGEEKFRRILESRFESEEVKFSKKEAKLISAEVCSCGEEKCKFEPSKISRIEKECIKNIGKFDIEEASNGELSNFLASVLQVVYSGRNIIPGFPGRVYEEGDLPDETNIRTDNLPSIVKLKEGGGKGLPKVEVFELKGEEKVKKITGEVGQILTDDHKHWRNNHMLYEWVDKIQQDPEIFEWNTIIPLKNSVPFRGYLSTPCTKKEIAKEVLDYIETNR